MILTKQCVANAEIGSLKGAPDNGNIPPAPQLTLPSSPARCLQDMCAEAVNLLSKIDSQWFGLDNNVGTEISNLPTEELTETLQLQLSEAKTMLQDLAVAAANGALVLGAVRENVVTRLEDDLTQRETVERLRSAYVGG